MVPSAVSPTEIRLYRDSDVLLYSNYISLIYIIIRSITTTITRPHPPQPLTSSEAVAAHKAPTPRQFASPSHTGPGSRTSSKRRATRGRVAEAAVGVVEAAGEGASWWLRGEVQSAPAERSGVSRLPCAPASCRRAAARCCPCSSVEVGRGARARAGPHADWRCPARWRGKGEGTNRHGYKYGLRLPRTRHVILVHD